MLQTRIPLVSSILWKFFNSCSKNIMHKLDFTASCPVLLLYEKHFSPSRIITASPLQLPQQHWLAETAAWQATRTLVSHQTTVFIESWAYCVCSAVSRRSFMCFSDEGTSHKYPHKNIVHWKAFSYWLLIDTVPGKMTVHLSVVTHRFYYQDDIGYMPVLWTHLTRYNISE